MGSGQNDPAGRHAGVADWLPSSLAASMLSPGLCLPAGWMVETSGRLLVGPGQKPSTRAALVAYAAADLAILGLLRRAATCPLTVPRLSQQVEHWPQRGEGRGPRKESQPAAH